MTTLTLSKSQPEPKLLYTEKIMVKLPAMNKTTRSIRLSLRIRGGEEIRKIGYHQNRVVFPLDYDGDIKKFHLKKRRAMQELNGTPCWGHSGGEFLYEFECQAAIRPEATNSARYNNFTWWTFLLAITQDDLLPSRSIKFCANSGV